MPFESNVFINCPFDSDYLPLLRSIIFCVIDVGLEPRIALETLNSGEPRIEKILRLVRECKFGIHDLSRIKAKKEGEYFRLNMPFELGLDVGCRVYGGGDFVSKRCLILEEERYRYQAAISDLSNSDIEAHRNEPELALRAVRNWLAMEAGLKPPGPTTVWGRFLDFMADNHDNLKRRGYSDADIAGLPIPELIACIHAWITVHPAHA